MLAISALIIKSLKQYILVSALVGGKIFFIFAIQLCISLVIELYWIKLFYF